MRVGGGGGGGTGNGESNISKERKSKHMETICRVSSEARRKEVEISLP